MFIQRSANIDHGIAMIEFKGPGLVGALLPDIGKFFYFDFENPGYADWSERESRGKEARY